MAPESDDNPWHYKISWNPRNIVMAGKSGAVYKKDEKMINIPYNSLFDKNEIVNIPGLGKLACYPNRDSLSYIPLYGLEETSTFIRTTLRHPSFLHSLELHHQCSLTDEGKTEILNCEQNTVSQHWLDKSIASKTAATNFMNFLIRYVNEEDRL